MPSKLSLIRWRQHFTSGFLLALFFGLLTGVWIVWSLRLKWQTGAHGDFFWSWAIGHWEWTHHTIFLANPATWNGSALQGPWVNLEWGWQALLGLLGPHLTHAPLLLVLSAITWLGAWILSGILLWTLWPPSRHHIVPWLLLASCLSLITGFWTLRPQILSAVFWPILLLILWVGRSHPRTYTALIPLTLIWSNIHGDYLLIPLLLAVDGAEAFYHRDPVQARRVIGWLITVFALIILGTPAHIHTITYAVQLSHNPWIARGISEWWSPNFSQPFWLVVLGLWVISLLAVWHRRLPVIVLIWWGGTVCATLLHNRFFLYNAPLTALLLAAALTPPNSPSLAWSWRPYAAAAIGGALLTWALWPFSWTAYLHTPHYRAAMIAWTQQHPTAGLLLVPYSDAGEWEAAHVPHIYIDGRADLFLTRSTRFQTYIHWNQGLISVTPLIRQGVREIIWPTANPQDVYLRTAHWHPVFHADQLTVWRPSYRLPSG